MPTAINTLRYQGDLPTVVYARNVTDAASALPVTGENRGKAFLVHANGANLAPAFVAAGATPGAIGWVNTDAYEKNADGSPRLYVFRASRPGDTVAWRDGTILRYESQSRPDPSTFENVQYTDWYAIKSLPQRALDGVGAFDVFDPGHIYDYYASLVGAVLAKATDSNRSLLDMRNPLKTPEAYLGRAAASVGARFKESDSVPLRRNKIADAAPLSRIRGVSAAMTATLRHAGYDGYVEEVHQAIGVSASSPVDSQWTIRLLRIDVRALVGSVVTLSAPALTLVFSDAPGPGLVPVGSTTRQAFENLAAALRDGGVDAEAGFNTTAYVSVSVPVGATVTTTLPVALAKVTHLSPLRRDFFDPPTWPTRTLVFGGAASRAEVSAYRESDGQSIEVLLAVSGGSAGGHARIVVTAIDNFVPRHGDCVRIRLFNVGSVLLVDYVFRFSNLVQVIDASRADVLIVPGDSAATITNLVAAISGSAYMPGPVTAYATAVVTAADGVSVEAAPRLVAVPHGALNTPPASYYPTTTLRVHLNQVDGRMLDEVPAPEHPQPGGPNGITPAMPAAIQAIMAEAVEDVLPVGARIAEWVSDARLPYASTPDALSVSDSLTVLDV